jgi:Asp/Glu/hydantoin racemase
MAMKIWHQSFTTLARVPAYVESLTAHVRKVVRPDTEVEIHGSHPGTHGHKPGDGPSTDVGYAYLQSLHMHQFAYAAILAEERGFDAYAIATLPEPGLREVRSLVSIPVVGYGEATMLTACQLGQKFGVLLFIKEMIPQIQTNVRTHGLQDRFAGARYVGFPSGDVIPHPRMPDDIKEKFYASARALIADGADVIIPGEAPLSVLLKKEGISRVDDVPILDGIACTLKQAEVLVDLKRQLGVTRSTHGYYQAMPPRERIKELAQLYGITKLFETDH